MTGRVRLFVLMAREAPVGVVFRVGPEGVVQMWRWDTGTDEFTAGQWFQGILYDYACDLSPDGRYLVLKLSRGGSSYHTVISKPPYFSALAYYPANRTRGGGEFLSADEVRVWAKPYGKWFVREGCPLQFAEWSRNTGRYEDYKHRGWEVVHSHPDSLSKFSEDLGPKDVGLGVERWSTEDLEQRLVLQFRIKRSGDKAVATEIRARGLGFVTEHYLVWGEMLYLIDEFAWAGFDQRGRCIVARDGCLVEVTVEGGRVAESVLIDLRAYEFEEVPPPNWALRWD